MPREPEPAVAGLASSPCSTQLLLSPAQTTAHVPPRSTAFPGPFQNHPGARSLPQQNKSLQQHLQCPLPGPSSSPLPPPLPAAGSWEDRGTERAPLQTSQQRSLVNSNFQRSASRELLICVKTLPSGFRSACVFPPHVRQRQARVCDDCINNSLHQPDLQSRRVPLTSPILQAAALTGARCPPASIGGVP